MTPLLLTIPEAAKTLAISRSKLYQLVAAGEIPTVRIARARRIRVDDLDSYVRRLNGGRR